MTVIMVFMIDCCIVEPIRLSDFPHIGLETSYHNISVCILFICRFALDLLHPVPGLAINAEHDLVVMIDCMVKPIRLVDHPHIDLGRGNHVDTKLRV